MTAEERVQAVVKFGFTERQARFLVTVMLHSGVCLLRHYTAFAGIVHGQKTRKFFAKLVRHGYATAHPCRHNRGRVYHVHHKPLYRAIGETDRRLRRPMSAARVMERLTLLDALLACPDVVWLATSEEKQVHLFSLVGIPTDEAARLALRERVSRPPRGALDEMPIGIDLAGRWVFVYVVTGDQLEDFHRFLQRRVAVLSVLPAWTLRIAFPMSHQWLRKQYEECVRQELAKPWPDLIKRLKWYFEQRRRTGVDRTPIDNPEKYAEEHFCFHSTRYQVLYKRWLSEGDSALEVVSSDATADRMARYKVHPARRAARSVRGASCERHATIDTPRTAGVPSCPRRLDARHASLPARAVHSQPGPQQRVNDIAQERTAPPKLRRGLALRSSGTSNRLAPRRIRLHGRRLSASTPGTSVPLAWLRKELCDVA